MKFYQFNSGKIINLSMIESLCPKNNNYWWWWFLIFSENSEIELNETDYALLRDYLLTNFW